MGTLFPRHGRKAPTEKQIFISLRTMLNTDTERYDTPIHQRIIERQDRKKAVIQQNKADQVQKVIIGTVPCTALSQQEIKHKTNIILAKVRFNTPSAFLSVLRTIYVDKIGKVSIWAKPTQQRALKSILNTFITLWGK